MAAQQSAQTEPRSAQRAVALDGRVCVAGAAWIEAAARPEQRTQRQLVAADQPQRNLARPQHFCVIAFQCRSRLARRSPSLAWRAASRAETVTSTGGSE